MMAVIRMHKKWKRFNYHFGFNIAHIGLGFYVSFIDFKIFGDISIRLDLLFFTLRLFINLKDKAFKDE